MPPPVELVRSARRIAALHKAPVQGAVAAVQQALEFHRSIQQMLRPQLELLAWAKAQHDERTIAKAGRAQVARVVGRWRRRFRVFRPRELARIAADQGRPAEAVLTEALVMGVFAAWRWRAANWARLGPRPAVYVDDLLRKEVLRAADRWLRQLARDEGPGEEEPTDADPPARPADPLWPLEASEIVGRLQSGLPPRERGLLDVLRASYSPGELLELLACGPGPQAEALAERLGISRGYVRVIWTRLKGRLAAAMM